MADAAPQAKELTLLIKLLKMTTSAHDSEALAAVRKANEQLKRFGGDWETLLTKNVTIIADPFEGITKPPPQAKKPQFSTPSPPPRSKPMGTPFKVSPSTPPKTPQWQHRVPPVSTLDPLRYMDTNTSSQPCQACTKTIPAGRGICVNYAKHGFLYFFCDQNCESDWFKQYAPKQQAAQAQPSLRQPRANAYSGNCKHCGNFIPAKAGFIIPKANRGWDTVCSLSCQPVTPKTSSPKASIDDL